MVRTKRLCPTVADYETIISGYEARAGWKVIAAKRGETIILQKTHHP